MTEHAVTGLQASRAEARMRPRSLRSLGHRLQAPAGLWDHSGFYATSVILLGISPAMWGVSVWG